MHPLAALVGALVLVASAAAADAAPPAARHGQLRGTTTITWSGMAGILLDVPRAALLSDGDADLVVDGGSYAFVRLVGPPRSNCVEAIGPYCGSTMISFLRALHDPPVGGSRARSHWTTAPDPATIAAPRVGVYLFTDGHATLTLRTNLSGRSAYRAGGMFRGRVTRLPRECAPTACSAAPAGSNSVTYGGSSYDLGRAGGWAEYIGVAANASKSEHTNQFHGISGCLYPNPVNRGLRADPADYPYGCGVIPPDDDQAYPAIVGEVNGAPLFGSARASHLWWTAARGPQYVGYRAKSAGTVAARVDAYGIWFNLGIR